VGSAQDHLPTPRASDSGRALALPKGLFEAVQTVESTHPTNVVIVRRMYEAFAAWDIEAMIALASPDMEIFPLRRASSK
jgi:hypothetical protein